MTRPSSGRVAHLVLAACDRAEADATADGELAPVDLVAALAGQRAVANTYLAGQTRITSAGLRSALMLMADAWEATNP